MPLASMLVGAGTSIIGGVLGANAANKAAQQQAAADTQAANAARQAGTTAIGTQQQLTGQQVGYASPFIQSGQAATGQLNQMMAPGGYLSSTWNQQFQAPTAAQVEQTPGYQFALQQGTQALNRGAAARGNLLSSGAQKSLMQYGTGLASQYYQQAYNNAMNTYGTNYQTFRNNQQDLYNRLYGLSGQGIVATGSLNQMLQQAAENQGQIGLKAAGMYGQDITNMGAAQAAGTMGAANAWRGALSGVSGAVMGGMMGGLGGGGGTANLSDVVGSNPEDYVGMGMQTGAPPSWVTGAGTG